MQCSLINQRFHSQSSSPGGQVNDCKIGQKRTGNSMHTVKSFSKVCLVALLIVSQAQADIIVSGFSDLNGSFNSVSSNVLVTSEDFTFGDPTFSGSGFGTQSFSLLGNPLGLTTGDSFRAFSSIGASAPPNGDAQALAIGSLTFTNSSATVGSVNFTVNWNLTANTPTIFDPADFGNVEVFAFMLDQNGQELLNSGSSLFISSATPIGGGLFNLAGSQLFNYTLNPGDSFHIDLATQSSGVALSTAVPEPGTFLLLGTALPALLLGTRRHKQAVVARTSQ